MTRTHWLGLLLLLTAAALPARQEDKAAHLKQALALQEVVQKVIDDAEPSVACVLVSRSDAYQLYDAGPAPDQPGKLGGLDWKKLAEHPLVAKLTDPERDRLRK